MKLNRLMKEHYARELKGIKAKEVPIGFEVAQSQSRSRGWGRLVLTASLYLLLTAAATTPFYIGFTDRAEVSREELAGAFTPITHEAAAKLTYINEYFKTKGGF